MGTAPVQVTFAFPTVEVFPLSQTRTAYIYHTLTAGGMIQHNCERVGRGGYWENPAGTRAHVGQPEPAVK